MLRSTFLLMIWLLLCYGAAAVGGLLSANGVSSWYPSLIKPSFNPPNWVFGPVWTLLYGMMAVAAWLVTRHAAQGGEGTRRAIALFLVQLVLNALWSGLFFGARQPGWAFVEIIALWLAIAATIAAFLPIDRWAAGLMAPYLAWVTFASVLNGSLWWLNRT